MSVFMVMLVWYAMCGIYIEIKYDKNVTYNRVPSFRFPIGIAAFHRDASNWHFFLKFCSLLHTIYQASLIPPVT